MGAEKDLDRSGTLLFRGVLVELLVGSLVGLGILLTVDLAVLEAAVPLPLPFTLGVTFLGSSMSC